MNGESVVQYRNDYFAGLPAAFKPRAQTLTRRDSLSSTSDSGSDVSGDSRISYDTVGTGVSTLQDGSESSAWGDDPSEQWPQVAASVASTSRRPSVAFTEDSKAWQAVESLALGSSHDARSVPHPGLLASGQQPAQLPTGCRVSDLPGAQYATCPKAYAAPVLDHLTTSRGINAGLHLKSVHSDSYQAQTSELSNTSNLVSGPNPRRTSTRPVPSLVREGDRRKCLVEQLVDASAELVAMIWPMSTCASVCKVKSTSGYQGLRYFVKEVLQRSKTSYNSLQVALWYLVRLHASGALSSRDAKATNQLECGRRMLLTSLIVASKYLQDKNFSAKAWSKISGLPAKEIIANELVFLNAIDHKLHVHDINEFMPWSNVVMQTAEAIKVGSIEKVRQTWRAVLDWTSQGVDIANIAERLEELQPCAKTFSTVSLPRLPLQTGLSSMIFDAGEQASPASPVDRPGSMRPATPMSYASITAWPNRCPSAPRMDSRLSTPALTPQSSANASESPAVSIGNFSLSAATYTSSASANPALNNPHGSIPQRPATAIYRPVRDACETPLDYSQASNRSSSDLMTVSTVADSEYLSFVAPITPPPSSPSETESSENPSQSLDMLVQAMRGTLSAQVHDSQQEIESSDEYLSEEADSDGMSRFEMEQDYQEDCLSRRHSYKAAKSHGRHSGGASRSDSALQMKRKRSAKSSAESRRCTKAIRSVRQTQEATAFDRTSM